MTDETIAFPMMHSKNWISPTDFGLTSIGTRLGILVLRTFGPTRAGASDDNGAEKRSVSHGLRRLGLVDILVDRFIADRKTNTLPCKPSSY